MPGKPSDSAIYGDEPTYVGDRLATHSCPPTHGSRSILHQSCPTLLGNHSRTTPDTSRTTLDTSRTTFDISRTTPDPRRTTFDISRTPPDPRRTFLGMTGTIPCYKGTNFLHLCLEEFDMHLSSYNIAHCPLHIKKSIVSCLCAVNAIETVGRFRINAAELS